MSHCEINEFFYPTLLFLQPGNDACIKQRSSYELVSSLLFKLYLDSSIMNSFNGANKTGLGTKDHINSIRCTDLTEGMKNI